MNLGLYLSIPFCHAKCTFCNFASDAFAPGLLPGYLHALGAEIDGARARADAYGATLPGAVDTLYFGGGTPSLLAPAEIRVLFEHLRDAFDLLSAAEITIECAPGQLSEESLAEFQRQGVNRISFGVQSFIDGESAAVGRRHTAVQCRAEFERVRRAGVSNISLDLIAGLPHQTEASWRSSLDQAITSAVPHISVYLLEIDEDSRLGREVLRDGGRYGALAVPQDDEAARFYEIACEQLEAAGSEQYEISNFARAGARSRHNLKYWLREPYLGFGLEAHSMLLGHDGATLRFANTDDLDGYGAGAGRTQAPHAALPLLRVPTPVEEVELLTSEAVLEETFFLGLRLTQGVELAVLRERFGAHALSAFEPIWSEAADDGLLTYTVDRIALTARGRLLSNELFGRLLHLKTA